MENTPPKFGTIVPEKRLSENAVEKPRAKPGNLPDAGANGNRFCPDLPPGFPLEISRILDAYS